VIATITKRAARVGDLYLKGGTEVEVYPDQGTTLQVHYRSPDGDLHVTYNVQASWFASVAVYRRAKDLGYE
jgi:hypothetical protein